MCKTGPEYGLDYYYRVGKTNNIIIDPKSTRCTLSFRFVVDLFVYVDKDVSVKYVVMLYYFYLCVSLTSLLIIINAILHHSFARTLSLSSLSQFIIYIIKSIESCVTTQQQQQ